MEKEELLHKIKLLEDQGCPRKGYCNTYSKLKDIQFEYTYMNQLTQEQIDKIK